LSGTSRQSFSDSAALHDRQVSICGRLSSFRVSRDLPPLTPATRSSYVGLLSLALRVTSAHWQPDTPATSTLPPPVVKRSGSSRPPAPVRPHYSRRSSDTPGIPPQTSIPGR